VAVLFPRVKQLGHEFDHPPASSANIKNEWQCTSTPPLGIYGADRDNLIFILFI